MAHVIKLLLVRNLPGVWGRDYCAKRVDYIPIMLKIMLVNCVNEYPQPMGIIIGMAMV